MAGVPYAPIKSALSSPACLLSPARHRTLALFTCPSLTEPWQALLSLAELSAACLSRPSALQVAGRQKSHRATRDRSLASEPAKISRPRPAHLIKPAGSLAKALIKSECLIVMAVLSESRRQDLSARRQVDDPVDDDLRQVHGPASSTTMAFQSALAQWRAGTINDINCNTTNYHGSYLAQRSQFNHNNNSNDSNNHANSNDKLSFSLSHTTTTTTTSCALCSSQRSDDTQLLSQRTGRCPSQCSLECARRFLPPAYLPTYLRH